MRWYGWLTVVLGILIGIAHAVLGTVEFLIPFSRTSEGQPIFAELFATWHFPSINMLLLAGGLAYLPRVKNGAQALGGFIFLHNILFTILLFCTSLFITHNLLKPWQWIFYLCYSALVWITVRSIVQDQQAGVVK